MSRAADPHFEELFRREYPSIVRSAYLLVGDLEAAADVAQEAFTQAFVHWHKVSGYERPGAWVRRVAIRKAAKVRRRSAHQPAGLEPGADRPGWTPDVLAAVLSLPANQRAVVVLHHVEDLPLTEIADILGCSASTARVHLHRARKRLGVLLQEEVPDVAR